MRSSPRVRHPRARRATLISAFVARRPGSSGTGVRSGAYHRRASTGVGHPELASSSIANADPLDGGRAWRKGSHRCAARIGRSRRGWRTGPGIATTSAGRAHEGVPQLSPATFRLPDDYSSNPQNRADRARRETAMCVWQTSRDRAATRSFAFEARVSAGLHRREPPTARIHASQRHRVLGQNSACDGVLRVATGYPGSRRRGTQSRDGVPRLARDGVPRVAPRLRASRVRGSAYGVAS